MANMEIDLSKEEIGIIIDALIDHKEEYMSEELEMSETAKEASLYIAVYGMLQEKVRRAYGKI
jgi:hypothetical protein